MRQSDPKRRGALGEVGPVALIAGCHFLAALAVIEVSQLYGSFIGIWIANALSMALLIRWRTATIPSLAAVGLGAFGANAVAGVPLAVDLLYTACNVVQVAVAVRLLKGSDWAKAPPEPPAFIRAIAIGGGLAPVAAAASFGIVGVLGLGLPAPHSLIMWLASNALGFVLVFPPVMLASRAGLATLWREGQAWPLAASMLACATIAAIAAAQMQAPFLLVLLPLLAAAIYMPPFEITLITGATGAAFLCVGLTNGAQDYDLTLFKAGFQVPMAISMVLPCLASLLMETIRRRMARLAESEQRFRRAMEDAAIGMAIVGLDGRIIHCNRSFSDMLGYSPAELQDKMTEALTYPADRVAGAEALRQAQAGEIDSCQFEKRYLHRDGTPVWTRLSASTIRDVETGAPLHLIAQMENIDAAKRADLAVAEAEDRWTFALASAGQGVWDVNFTTGHTFYSDVWKAMLGYRSDELSTDHDLWLTMIHPDDRERVRQIDLDHLAGHTDHFEAEFRIRHKDGRWIWVLDRGRALERDGEGRVVRAIGTYTDISKQKEAEARIAESAAAVRREKDRLRVTLQSIGDAVICTDGEERLTFMNPVAEKLTGLRFADSAGLPVDEIYAPVDEESGKRLDLSAGSRARTTCGHTGRAVLVRRDGSRCNIREVIAPIASETAESVGRVIVFQDYTDARTMQRELAYAASHDALTGLMNRAAFLAAMDRAAEDCRQANLVSHLLFIDLDRFKSVNDGSGHAAGDALLRLVAHAIAGRIRSGDVLARIGGDEFAVILHHCGTEDAHRCAEMVCNTVRELDFAWAGVDHRIGASIGIATIERRAASVDEIIARADQACYRAKAAGRGSVAVSDAVDATEPVSVAA